MAEGWRLRASDPALDDIVARAGSTDPDVWSRLTESDIGQARAFTLSFLRIYQSAYLEVQEGLLSPEALEDLGINGLKESRLLQNMWPFVRGQLSTEFADYLAARFNLPQD